MITGKNIVMVVMTKSEADILKKCIEQLQKEGKLEPLARSLPLVEFKQALRDELKEEL